MMEAASVTTAELATVVSLEITHLDKLNLPQKNRVFKHRMRSTSSSPAEALLSQQSELQTTESKGKL